jgi:hypothetical protein
MAKIEKKLVCNKHGLCDFSLSGKIKQRWKCKKCVYDSSVKYKHGLKDKAIAYKGGKCIKCSYKKCKRALSFHHLDPSEKDFNIVACTSWEKMKAEIDKCILVCMNCHLEIHAEEDKKYFELQKYYLNKKEVYSINMMLINGKLSFIHAQELLEEKEGKQNRRTNLRLELYC